MQGVHTPCIFAAHLRADGRRIRATGSRLTSHGPGPPSVNRCGLASQWQHSCVQPSLERAGMEAHACYGTRHYRCAQTSTQPRHQMAHCPRPASCRCVHTMPAVRAQPDLGHQCRGGGRLILPRRRQLLDALRNTTMRLSAPTSAISNDRSGPVRR